MPEHQGEHIVRDEECTRAETSHDCPRNHDWVAVSGTSRQTRAAYHYHYENDEPDVESRAFWENIFRTTGTRRARPAEEDVRSRFNESQRQREEPPPPARSRGADTRSQEQKLVDMARHPRTPPNEADAAKHVLFKKFGRKID